ncbi:glycosyl hydrolase [Botryobacter ruber]|uniref:glycosyl hydrolase n=1 Tax=Botryobacter ruber TaxID=2171629 RepID=UPI000E0A5527|nr:glycosyl hydrolase [Botryobacter ruber]
MNSKWNRRTFLKTTGLAGLGVYASSIPLAGLVASCSKGAVATTSTAPASALSLAFQTPPAAAQPWVFWYWMHASASKEGITADLEAMKEAGIGGAYLMPIKGVKNPPLFEPVVEQLTPRWWEMVQYAMNEAKRLGLEIAMHASDGFALAGGPWITPELSMQKVVWSTTQTDGGRRFSGKLPQPPTNENYYRDIAVLAYPTPEGAGVSTFTVVPKVTSNKPDAPTPQFLVQEGNKENFSSKEPCWIQYAFDKPFTCRTIVIRTNGNNFQAQRLLVQVSDDGKTFRSLKRLVPPRHGWQDTDANNTHVIEPTTAKYFRFVYDKTGTEPGAEDIDSAKWSPSFKVAGIELSSTPRIHMYEGKTGEVWRISERTSAKQVPDKLCVPLDKIIDITEHLDASGNLNWNAPKGKWTIMRMGHTSTGHTNATGGAGAGLECDKFNPEAITLQFNGWFGETIKQVGPELAGEILKIFHVDSWECGSQNWSPVFREEFRKRRGYDLFTYLPLYAGIPLESAATSEKFLYDVRQTIIELVKDKFFVTMAELAHEKGCTFSAECVSPTMTSDGMLHFDTVDIPMGEFWLRSPTHDKPNDMLDAISGGHVYGKPIIQAECFTQLRMDWDEHPGNIKTLGDRNYALGFNKFVYHVFMHNPWMDRKPGMTLDPIGLFFQRDQTWWKPGRAWVTYAQRCQALLQQGNHVADIAVFTGEEIPRRAVLPDRLVPTLPGIFGPEVVAQEKKRLENEGHPLRQIPDGITHSANMADPENWTNPLQGYAYDSINRDALLRLAKVENGRIVLPGGASYGILVLPGERPMAPNNNYMTPELAARLLEMVKEGATVLMSERPLYTPSLQDAKQSEARLQQIVEELWRGDTAEATTASAPSSPMFWKVGKGRLLKGPYQASSFDAIGIARDVMAQESNGQQAKEIAWTHRSSPDFDIYFISNQQEKERTLELSLRTAGRVPELFDPVTGEARSATNWRTENGRTVLPLKLAPNGSMFVVLQQATSDQKMQEGQNWLDLAQVKQLEGDWQVKFDAEAGGPEEPQTFRQLSDWSKHSTFGIRHYSGTAVYKKTFDWKKPADKGARFFLDLGHVANIAEVTVNGTPAGVAWTAPYRVEITDALRPGKNELIIEVANTWANRLIGDHSLPEKDRLTWTTAPYRLEDKPLLEAGLLGPVTIQKTT